MTNDEIDSALIRLSTDEGNGIREKIDQLEGRVAELRKVMNEIRFCLSAPGPGTEAPPRKIDEAWELARNHSVEGDQFVPGEAVNYGIHGIPYTIVKNHWYGDYTKVWIKSWASSHSAPRIDVTKVKPVKITADPNEESRVHGSGCKTQCKEGKIDAS